MSNIEFIMEYFIMTFILGLIISIILLIIGWKLHISKLAKELIDFPEEDIKLIQSKLNYYTGSKIECNGIIDKKMLNLIVYFELTNEPKMIKETFPEETYKLIVCRIFRV